jgi:hypothetical protein
MSRSDRSRPPSVRGSKPVNSAHRSSRYSMVSAAGFAALGLEARGGGTIGLVLQACLVVAEASLALAFSPLITMLLIALTTAAAVLAYLPLARTVRSASRSS